MPDSQARRLSKTTSIHVLDSRFRRSQKLRFNLKARLRIPSSNWNGLPSNSFQSKPPVCFRLRHENSLSTVRRYGAVAPQRQRANGIQPCLTLVALCPIASCLRFALSVSLQALPNLLRAQKALDLDGI